MKTLNRGQILHRNELEEDVRAGRLNPQEAEERAAKAGLPPLWPEPKESDPFQLAGWSMLMTMAWIAWRSSSHVVQTWADQRRKHWVSLAPEGKRKGWLVEPAKALTSYDIELIEPEGRERFSAAQAELLHKLAKDEIRVSAYLTATNELVDVPADSWMHLSFNDITGEEFLKTLHGDNRYRRPLLPVRRVLELWPLEPPARNVSVPILAQPSRVSRGAKPKYDLPGFEKEALDKLDNEGAFDPSSDPKWRQSALEEHMRKWCINTWGKEPSEAWIRLHVSQIHREFLTRPRG
ncbi:MAG: hypothetical protein EOS21_11855 [Mesorhizobium sp.]|nr:MAG: hypothetical protein EOS21_11855 [Mesorhizobium sp.]